MTENLRFVRKPAWTIWFQRSPIYVRKQHRQGLVFQGWVEPGHREVWFGEKPRAYR